MSNWLTLWLNEYSKDIFKKTVPSQKYIRSRISQQLVTQGFQYVSHARRGLRLMPDARARQYNIVGITSILDILAICFPLYNDIKTNLHNIFKYYIIKCFLLFLNLTDQ